MRGAGEAHPGTVPETRRAGTGPATSEAARFIPAARTPRPGARVCASARDAAPSLASVAVGLRVNQQGRSTSVIGLKHIWTYARYLVGSLASVAFALTSN